MVDIVFYQMLKDNKLLTEYIYLKFEYPTERIKKLKLCE